MAHRIIDKPQGIILSSTLEQIRLSVEGEHADVTLSGPDGPLLQERYYAFDGALTLGEMNVIMEEYMRDHDLAYAAFTLSVGSGQDVDDTATFKTLYCDRVPPAGVPDMAEFLSENFLTTLCPRRLPPDDVLQLAFWTAEGEALTAAVDYDYRVEGSRQVLHGYLQFEGEGVADGVTSLSLPLEAITGDAAVRSKVRPALVRLLCFYVRVGSRSMTCYVDPELAGGRTFAFRNCFNALERVTLRALTTAKTVVDYSLATFAGHASIYDRKASASYEVQSGPLTSDEAAWIDQLFTSHQVFTALHSPLSAPVLITDSTCEIQDGDEAPNTVKFTWRYDHNRPAAALPETGGIFTYQFDPVFR